MRLITRRFPGLSVPSPPERRPVASSRAHACPRHLPECWKEIPFIQSRSTISSHSLSRALGHVLRVLPPMHCSRY